MTVWSFDQVLIVWVPIRRLPPEVDFRVLRSPAQSLSDWANTLSFHRCQPTCNTKRGLVIKYLASLFNTVRLAEGSPQSTAKAIVYNYLTQGWVFPYNPGNQRFEVNPPALEAAVRKLAAEVLQILGRGDYDGAGQLIVRYGIIPAEVRQKLAELEDLPVEILPSYGAMPKG